MSAIQTVNMYLDCEYRWKIGITRYMKKPNNTKMSSKDEKREKLSPTATIIEKGTFKIF